MGAHGKDFLIIFTLIIALFVMAVFGIGTNGVSTQNREYISTKERSVTARSEISQNNTQTGTQQEEQPIEDIIGLVGIELEITKLENTIDKSPYKGMVSIKKQTSGPRSTDVSREYITLTTTSGNQSGVIISDWKLISVVSGSTVKIGKASPRIYAGEINIEQTITLRPKDTVYITTGRSPLGVSFKVNKCTGYFTQFQKFTPTLRKSCPQPEEEITYYKDDPSIFLDNACMDFVNRLSRCSVYTKPLPLTLSRSCNEAIIGEINYNSCVDKHQDDSDFSKPEWRIFLKREKELWREKREIIKLVDENGKLVDFYSY